MQHGDSPQRSRTLSNLALSDSCDALRSRDRCVTVPELRRQISIDFGVVAPVVPGPGDKVLAARLRIDATRSARAKTAPCRRCSSSIVTLVGFAMPLTLLRYWSSGSPTAQMLCFLVGLHVVTCHLTQASVEFAHILNQAKWCVPKIHDVTRYAINAFDRLRPALPWLADGSYCLLVSPNPYSENLGMVFWLAAVLEASRLALNHVFLMSALRRNYEEAIIENNFLRAGFARLALHAESSELPEISRHQRFRPLLTETCRADALNRLVYEVIFQHTLDTSSALGDDSGLPIMSVMGNTDKLMQCRNVTALHAVSVEAADLFEMLAVDDSSGERVMSRGDICKIVGMDGLKFWQELAGDQESIRLNSFKYAVQECLSTIFNQAASVEDFNNIQKSVLRFLMYLQYLILGVTCMRLFIPDLAKSLGIFCSSVLLGGSFVFGTSMRELYESILLVTVTRPFDIGDRIDIGDGHIVVTKIQLLNTEAVNSYNEVIVLRNSILYQKAELKNLRRSREATLEISVHLIPADASPENIKSLEGFVRGYLSEHADKWHTQLLSYPLISKGVVHIQEHVEHRFRIKHRRSWQDMNTLRVDMSEAVYALNELMQQMGIKFVLPIQTVLPV